MNTKSTDFIESTSCVSRRLWVEVQGYADICPAINKAVRTELMRINTTGETRKPGGRLLFDLFSDIKDPFLLAGGAGGIHNDSNLVSRCACRLDSTDC